MPVVVLGNAAEAAAALKEGDGVDSKISTTGS
jgi:hypothetical protein